MLLATSMMHHQARGGRFILEDARCWTGTPCHCFWCPQVVIVRQLQSWGDDDIVDMLSFVDEKLKEGIIIVSNFEKYKKEVMSGQLDWTPMHSSELFWRENVEKFEERDFQALRVLLKIIETNRDVGTCNYPQNHAAVYLASSFVGCFFLQTCP